MAITLGQLSKKMAEAAKKTSTVSEKELDKLALLSSGHVKEAIQSVHAVDTATMLNSTTVSKEGTNTRLVGPTVGYATFVALGTSRMAARPFHEIAAKATAQDAKDFGLDANKMGL